MKNRSAAQQVGLPVQLLIECRRPRIEALQTLEQRVLAERIDKFLGRHVQRPHEIHLGNGLARREPSHGFEQHLHALLRAQTPDEQDGLRAGRVSIDFQKSAINAVVERMTASRDDREPLADRVHDKVTAA